MDPLALFYCGLCVMVIYLFTARYVDDFNGAYCEKYCPEMLAVNQPPTVMVQPSDVVAAVFERPWWEGGPAPR
jgi:hypothetical protein